LLIDDDVERAVHGQTCAKCLFMPSRGQSDNLFNAHAHRRRGSPCRHYCAGLVLEYEPRKRPKFPVSISRLYVRTIAMRERSGRKITNEKAAQAVGVGDGPE
jgi:hypothetical protein